MLVTVRTIRSDVDELTINQIRALRDNRRKRKIKLPKKLPTWKHPKPVENEYSDFLETYVDLLGKIVESTVVRFLPELVKSRQEDLPQSARVDSWADNAERLLRTMALSFGQANFDIPGTARDVADKTDVWNDKQWRKMMKAAVGVRLFHVEQWLNPLVDSFVNENVQLITKMTEDLKADIGGVVNRGLKAGSRHENLAKEIMDKVDISKSRARLIARDQVSKLNGQLTMNRQAQIGIEEYIWRTADDPRVRPSHNAHDDKTFKWSEPPANTGHPGNDIQCRCYAEPVFDPIIEAVAEGRVQ